MMPVLSPYPTITLNPATTQQPKYLTSRSQKQHVYEMHDVCMPYNKHNGGTVNYTVRPYIMSE